MIDPPQNEAHEYSDLLCESTYGAVCSLGQMHYRNSISKRVAGVPKIESNSPAGHAAAGVARGYHGM